MPGCNPVRSRWNSDVERGLAPRKRKWEGVVDAFHVGQHYDSTVDSRKQDHNYDDDDISYNPRLDTTSESGDLHTVELLLSHDTNVNAPDEELHH